MKVKKTKSGARSTRERISLIEECSKHGAMAASWFERFELNYYHKF